MKHFSTFFASILVLATPVSEASTCELLAEEARTQHQAKHTAAPPSEALYRAESLIKEGETLCQEGADDVATAKLQEALELLNSI